MPVVDGVEYYDENLLIIFPFSGLCTISSEPHRHQQGFSLFLTHYPSHCRALKNLKQSTFMNLCLIHLDPDNRRKGSGGSNQRWKESSKGENSYNGSTSYGKRSHGHNSHGKRHSSRPRVGSGSLLFFSLLNFDNLISKFQGLGETSSQSSEDAIEQLNCSN